MLSLMHLSPRRGYLLAATGSAITQPQLARLTGCDSDECSRLLAELRSSGCFSCTDDGTIYSRRMVKDEAKRQKCSEAGRKGGGNPTFKGEGVTTATFKGVPKGAPKGAPKGGPKPPETRDQRPEGKASPSRISDPPPLKVKVPPDPNHKPAVDGFCSRWESTYGQKYAFNAGKDGDAVKWMLSQVADLSTLFAVFDRYFADRSDFVTSARHTLGVLRSQFVKWTVDQLPPAAAPRPAGGYKTKQQQQADTFARLADFLEESERAALNTPEGQP